MDKPRITILTDYYEGPQWSPMCKPGTYRVWLCAGYIKQKNGKYKQVTVKGVRVPLLTIDSCFNALCDKTGREVFNRTVQIAIEEKDA